MEIFQKYIIPNTVSPFILSFAQFFFDKMVYDYDDYQAFYDSALAFGAQVGSKILTNTLVAKTVMVLDNYYTNNFVSYFTEPFLNLLIYGYLYVEKFKKTQFAFKSKGDYMLMIMPVIHLFIGMILDKTIVEWKTGYTLKQFIIKKIF